MVCATVSKTGEPIYFTMPQEASLVEVADRAFEVRHGRSPNQAERWLMNEAMRRIRNG